VVDFRVISPGAPLPVSTDDRLDARAAAAIRAAIRLAGGREVCFACTVDDEGRINTARVVARGDVGKVLALPGFAKRGEMLVHNHPSGLLEPSQADLAVAQRIHGDGIGFGIVDNAATEIYVVVEVPRHEPLVALDADAIDADLGPEGPIAALHGAYEDRPSQRRMASTIARLYSEGGIGLLEAGTGVGKSLGYLLPALRWAAANGERTVVSTNTINLQEQLIGKDLPFLAKALTDQDVRFAMLKGWRNYLCLTRLEQARSNEGTLLDAGERDELATIAAWAERTKDGSVADLATPPRAEIWDEVAAEPDLCTRLQCPAYQKCFVYAARRQAAKADVVVVNHHLLLSDVAVRRATQNWEEAAVLPSYDRLVIDEGHHLEDAAASHLGATVTRRALVRAFNRLERRQGRGLLASLVGKLSSQSDLLSVASLDLVNQRLTPAVHAARDKGAQVFDLLDTVLMEAGVPIMRLTDDFANHPVWRGGLDVALSDLLAEIELLHEGLRVVRDRLEGSGKLEESVAPMLNEIRAVGKRLQTSGDSLRSALRPAPDADPTVRWIEVRGRDRGVAVSAVPLDLAPILREDLFKRVQTTVITSATLATDSRFDFLASRLGLDEKDVIPHTDVFPSPFDYEQQSILAVPSDFPAPNVDASGHFQAVIRATIDLAEASDGGLFILFTSHKDLRAAAAELRARGIERRWPLLVHGEDARDALLRRFRDAGRAILLGTASFWEGVDVPGRALRGLLISRFPFRVPTEPVTAAHCESIEAKGGDAFTEYMMPHAALRLKQGFGRLIRTATDRGVVVLADPRATSKPYGRELVKALPPARRLFATWSKIREEIGTFYSPDGA
jgi:ATP-dependent DNA helicase DinG